MIKESDIIYLLSNSIDYEKYPFQICNGFIYEWESDYWILDRKGFTIEYEIKLSRSDYRRDEKKIKHQQMHFGNGANKFCYVCPYGLLSPFDIYPEYGLIYVCDRELKVVKRAKKLHDKEYSDFKKIALKYHDRWRELWKQKYLNGSIDKNEYNYGLEF